MEEKQLISQLRELRQIKPGKNWVSLTKKDILGENPGFTFFPYPYLKPAFAGFVAIFVMFGIFGFAKKSLPGDVFYVFKKTFENGQAAFVSDNDQLTFQLELANNRLEDLAKAPAKNLAPTMNEFQANMSAAAKNLTKFDASSSDPAVIKKIVRETKKIAENKQKIESLGVVVDSKGADEFNSALAGVVENLIQDLESRTLTKEKADIVIQMKNLFKADKYSEALEFYLLNQ